MSDLIERLRYLAGVQSQQLDPQVILLKDAADEIERLREREKQLMGDVNDLVCELKGRPGYTMRENRLRDALKDVDRWLALFIAAWDKSRDKKKPSEAPVALMEAIRQHSAVREALENSDE